MLGIAILNYKNYKDTIECIETIKKQTMQNFLICVVDNNSQNDSIENIRCQSGNEKIIYIQNKENKGFAAGNNVAIRELINRGCRNVFVLNNDTLLPDKNSLEKIKKSLEEIDENVGVLNVDCISTEGNYLLPSYRRNGSIEEYIVGTKKWYIKYLLKSLLNIDGSIKTPTKEAIEELDKLDSVIQGCAYILTSNYLKNGQLLFEKTFLYCEELALDIKLEKYGLKTKNLHDVKIIHKEGSSTIGKKSIKKKIKKLNMMRESLRIVEKDYDEHKREIIK